MVVTLPLAAIVLLAPALSLAYNMRYRDTDSQLSVCPLPACMCTASAADPTQWQQQMAVCTKIPTQTLDQSILSLTVANGQIDKLTTQMTEPLGDHLQELVLRSCEIDSIEPGAFDRLTGLARLKLTDNRLKRLDPGLFKRNAKLTALHLDGNMLRRLEPALLTKLDRLSELHLENNRLEQVPTKIPLSVTYLNMSHNNLVTVGDVQDLREVQLKVLDLCGNPLEPLSAAALRSVSHLQHLCLGDTATALPHDTSALLTHLSRLELVAAPERGAVLEQASQRELQHMTTLTSLAIVNYHLSSMTFLNNLTSLSTLKLDNVSVDSIDFDAVLSSKPYLTHLSLDNSPGLAQHFVKHLYLISRLHSLQAVSMRNADITRLQPFPAPPQPLRLDLGGNPLTCTCGTAWLLTMLVDPRGTMCAAPPAYRGLPVGEVVGALHCTGKREGEGGGVATEADQSQALYAPHTIPVQTNQATDLATGYKHHVPHKDNAVVYIVLGCFLLVLVAIGIVLWFVYWHFKKKGGNKVEPEHTEPPLEPTFQELKKASEDTNLIKDVKK